jgi:hypothetical protein
MEFRKRTLTLFEGDKSLVEHNLINLLRKTLAYKKGWLQRIQIARQRFYQKVAQDNDLILQTKNSSTLLVWMKRHKDTLNFKKRRTKAPEETNVLDDGTAIGDEEYLQQAICDGKQEVGKSTHNTELPTTQTHCTSM